MARYFNQLRTSLAVSVALFNAGTQAFAQVQYFPRIALQQESATTSSTEEVAGKDIGKNEPSTKDGELPGDKEELPAKARPKAKEFTYTAESVPAQSWQLPIQYDRCGYSACNPPPQPQVAAGRCQPCIKALDCANSPFPQRWSDARPYDFQPLRHGEYIGPVRLPATIDNRLRAGDRLRFVFSESRSMQPSQYRLMVGDELLIESLTDSSIRQGDLTRGIQIQPDGFLYLKLIGLVRAEGLTITQLRRNLEEAYKDKIINPAIDITPIRTNARLTSILASVDNRGGAGGQSFPDFVHQDGTIRLPSIGAICVQGLTLDELKREVNLRYSQVVWGLEVDPVIDQEAPHFVYVVGEVNKPDRYLLNGPTTVSQALALAGGWKIGGNMRQIVIFRRAEDWRLLATKIDINGQLKGRTMMPADDIWLRDNDLIVVPPSPIQQFDNFVKLVFKDGIYGIVPFNGFSITRFQQAGIN